MKKLWKITSELIKWKTKADEKNAAVLKIVFFYGFSEIHECCYVTIYPSKNAILNQPLKGFRAL